MINFFKPAVWKYTNSWEMMDPGSQKNNLLPDQKNCQIENNLQIELEIKVEIEMKNVRLIVRVIVIEQCAMQIVTREDQISSHRRTYIIMQPQI